MPTVSNVLSTAASKAKFTLMTHNKSYTMLNIFWLQEYTDVLCVEFKSTQFIDNPQMMCKASLRGGVKSFSDDNQSSRIVFILPENLGKYSNDATTLVIDELLPMIKSAVKAGATLKTGEGKLVLYTTDTSLKTKLEALGFDVSGSLQITAAKITSQIGPAPASPSHAGSGKAAVHPATHSTIAKATGGGQGGPKQTQGTLPGIPSTSGSTATKPPAQKPPPDDSDGIIIDLDPVLGRNSGSRRP